ncbi:MAG TPA: hypothetical protein DIC31_02060 [Rhizobiales bacterium]|nr:hypothetical protein [Hyphomicrobiales bacterium]HBH40417.1 hypothetical protein [Hyphomicrobiales bacterium]HBR27194.1 hypothetical protein [Hyphomicrobiales bacterium]HCL61262.1 hypothetical protein [Hyphomicrobiales bacterium]
MIGARASSSPSRKRRSPSDLSHSIDSLRHGRARPGHLRFESRLKTWVPGPRPGMTSNGRCVTNMAR